MEKIFLFRFIMEVEDENCEKHFIGFDFSTQQIKAVVINEDLKVEIIYLIRYLVSYLI